MKDFNFEEIIESCPMDYIYGKLTGDDYFDLFVLKSSIKEFNLKLLSEVLGYNIDFKIIFSKNYNFIEEYCKGLNESFSLKLIDNDYVIIWFNRYLFKKYNKLKLGFKKEKEILDLFLDSLKEYITFNHIDRKYVIEKTNKDIFFDDKNNEFKDISGIAENIFYKRAIEYGVNKNDEMFFEIFNYLDDVVIIKEGEKTIYVNNAFEKLYGLNCKDLYRENSMIVKLDRIHPKDRYKFNNIDFKKFFMAEARIIRADNEVRNVLFRANSIKNENGESIRRIIIINDITNNIEKGNEMEKLRMEFFANISHEFKTPVNLIYSALQLLELKLKNNRDGDIYINYIKMAKQNVFRLLKLINNLIDSTKLEAGFFNVNIKNHDIVSCVEDITMSICNFAEKNKISITFDTEEEEKIIAFDFNHLERILLNVLSNAIKFNRENGNIDVYISFDDKYANISIKDTGIGIQKDKIDLLFHRFKKINNRLTKVNEGSGIGLYIAKELVKINGGDMIVNSELGEGTEFIIKLPIKKNESKVLDEIALTSCEIENREELYKVELSDIYSI
ncbi:PAS domain-containing sensor histidine kinase [Clostridium perfringens]|uniref:histidine kinase n=1 Tax=Clostridium perfringens (strain SM101 / Type A) TaxID=289380 RepID=Q0SU30_CLOPS|nr:PAS domain-containing sensor histidine kinase [Clostridium perfringens]ABG87053.1 sensory box histidine kinase/response regulator [Clostridium perfringens SM101]MBP2861030.1 PAS domain-containing sensor histidine kinase [Clostridium perfringens]MDH5061216.1 Sensor histidine kinase TmoS [Clostridium perfringens NCTC 8239]MDK0772443.1 PAS domain-containing sensor histidine kinase [Clostridium perfringens]MDK0777641.1 PAS domain-containing sensor histidine kinase [Clostridium perfringens]